MIIAHRPVFQHFKRCSCPPLLLNNAPSRPSSQTIFENASSSATPYLAERTTLVPMRNQTSPYHFRARHRTEGVSPARHPQSPQLWGLFGSLSRPSLRRVLRGARCSGRSLVTVWRPALRGSVSRSAARVSRFRFWSPFGAASAADKRAPKRTALRARQDGRSACGLHVVWRWSPLTSRWSSTTTSTRCSAWCSTRAPGFLYNAWFTCG
eukprot:scaffold7352_cov254-Pinguiococcus_pyrenoidosus.AAC.42